MIGISLLFMVLSIYFNLFRPRPKYPVYFDGHVEDGFEPVLDAFKHNFESGFDMEGAAFSVYYKGQIVVDLWGGYSDSSKNRTWERNTLAVTYSSTKAVCALCIALLVDRQLLKYDDLVIEHWPEFGRHGKQNITVRMLVSHQAGLALFDEEITYALIRNRSAMSLAIENQKPNWDVDESKAGYHVLTYGFLIDQLITRVDPGHRTLAQFFKEEIATPYNLDFYIGLPPVLESNLARIVPPRNREFIYGMNDFRFAYVMAVFHFQKSDSLLNRVLRNPKWLLVDHKGHTVFNDAEVNQLEIGSAMGIGTARALAELIYLLGPGRLLNKTTFEQIRLPLFKHHSDEVLALPMTYGHGFEYSPNNKGSFMIGHTGYGGQNFKYDPHYDLGLAYLRNGLSHLNGDLNYSYKNLKEALYKCISSKQH